MEAVLYNIKCHSIKRKLHEKIVKSEIHVTNNLYHGTILIAATKHLLS
jgi:hypothetical protein